MSESQGGVEGAGTYRIGHYRDEKTDDRIVEIKLEGEEGQHFTVKAEGKFYELEVTDTIARKLLKLLKGINEEG